MIHNEHRVQIEVQTNLIGDREIVAVECDPSNDAVVDKLETEQIGEGAWEFRFVVPENFDGSEAVFQSFRHYGLDPDSIQDRCREVMLG